ncbi:ectonucleotide pyrophosphatase/phosphodiesterase [Pedobacter xixiisoli]|uniref:Predicted pyrophosphatase or phosphodiesterase, AlkP superfamily n=1 Tax=Pedobacter xixiisoli TaxID=1476464 RepID=A0A286A8K9_9SPHI|nr:ectonucleotide pyrophosphatase/phosphodiesterase [Pedobacter xixiisoli]SOD18260.1 Predicted pyrophosphatase or phosphodiesterase, AlkP superfamily [Pedobacter xixiisoli]
MKSILLIIGLLICSNQMIIAQNLSQQIVAGRANDSSQINKPYVIYISADGFRHDYSEKYQAKNLLALREKGVKAISMKPSYPSVTFSNHYTLATGMYPSKHGIVNNSFYDPKKQQIYVKTDPSAIKDSTWYGGLPIWVLAEQQKMLSAAFYWLGSETAVKGIRPTYWYNFNTKIPMDVRITAVKDWLQLPAEKRPHLINFYFPEVDVAGHYFGSNSKETAAAVKLIDDCIGEMVQLTKEVGLDVNFVFVSDHGMTEADNKNTLDLPSVIDTAKFIVPNGDALIQIYAKDKKDIRPLYKQLKADGKDYDVYLTNKMPKRWHYSAKDNKDGRIGDIILIPKLPKIFNLTGKPTSIGKHGFDNDMPDMQAVFYAWGPAFKEALTIDSFENVHIYPLLAKILGLSYTHQIDGDIRVLAPILK